VGGGGRILASLEVDLAIPIMDAHLLSAVQILLRRMYYVDGGEDMESILYSVGFCAVLMFCFAP
jgi:hypothetical protein